MNDVEDFHEELPIEQVFKQVSQRGGNAGEACPRRNCPSPIGNIAQPLCQYCLREAIGSKGHPDIDKPDDRYNKYLEYKSAVQSEAGLRDDEEREAKQIASSILHAIETLR